MTLQLVLFGIYLVALRSVARGSLDGSALRAVILLAILFRATLLFVPPFYSDDLYRYLWDGHVQLTGRTNPYLHAPAAQALVPLREEFFPRINHPEIPTIYPPVAQFLFLLVAFLHKSVPALKGSMVLMDLGIIWILWRLLHRFEIPKGQLVIYAWSPLVVAEVAGNGHLDALAMFLLVAAVHLIILERFVLSTIALGLSIGSKFLSLLAFPVLARRLRPWLWGAPGLVLVLVYLPYAGAGARLFGGLREYGERWQRNDLFFTFILRGLEWVEPTPFLKESIARLHVSLGHPDWMMAWYRYVYPAYLARMLVFGFALAVVGFVLWRRLGPIRGTFWVIGGVLLLSPTAYPWYFLWIVPFLVLNPSRAWILLTGLVPLSYLDPAPVVDGVHGHPWIRWVEYLPFCTLLLWDAIISRRWGRPVTLFGLKALAGKDEPQDPSKRAG